MSLETKRSAGDKAKDVGAALAGGAGALIGFAIAAVFVVFMIGGGVVISDCINSQGEKVTGIDLSLLPYAIPPDGDGCVNRSLTTKLLGGPLP